MLKRLLWLAFFCAALCLLLGWMVRHSGGLPREPVVIRAQTALAPRAVNPPQEAPEAEQTRETARPLVAQAPSQPPTALPAGVYRQPHRQARYQVFHLPDKAG